MKKLRTLAGVEDRAPELEVFGADRREGSGPGIGDE